jgi:hypothetical protein
MTAVIVLFALNALIGFAIGSSFSWLAIAASDRGYFVSDSGNPGFGTRHSFTEPTI